jgi:hypothetical protein
MARRSTQNQASDGELRRLLKRHNCPIALHAVRTYFLGSIASPKIETRPMQVLENLWGGELPEFESLDEANELIDALINGLWNRLSRHQSRKHPFRLTPLRPPKDKESIKKFAQTRVEELEAFINGLFGDDEALELPESAHVAVKNLGDVRSFFLGFVQYADDHDTAEAVRETVGNMQRLSIICGKEINVVMLSCVRARRATLDTMRGAAPGLH